MPGDDTPSDDAGNDASGQDADAEPPGRDPSVDADANDDGLETDPERAALLREIADDVRGDTSESEQLANVLYRTSDIYAPDEDTTPEEVMQNVKFILEVKERGGLGR
ncbi:hypothetical protein [Halorubellus sp. PRR65]|uniref:hypothetical protein n=1 Tax=Halorubellus sp. PRR65 TaxID=3098148 RepID=UPI002B25A44A|nr:hypothetical protein [Halorubellus sp. PRR65]